MTLVSEQEFIANGTKYFDMALDDKVYIQRGDINFRIMPVDYCTDECDDDFEEDEEEFNLYESLNRAFADMRLMMDGKIQEKTLEEFILEMEQEQLYEIQDSNYTSF
jgi:hypothetical protein